MNPKRFSSGAIYVTPHPIDNPNPTIGAPTINSGAAFVAVVLGREDYPPTSDATWAYLTEQGYHVAFQPIGESFQIGPHLSVHRKLLEVLEPAPAELDEMLRKLGFCEEER